MKFFRTSRTAISKSGKSRGVFHEVGLRDSSGKKVAFFNTYKKEKISKPPRPQRRKKKA